MAKAATPAKQATNKSTTRVTPRPKSSSVTKKKRATTSSSTSKATKSTPAKKRSPKPKTPKTKTATSSATKRSTAKKVSPQRSSISPIKETSFSLGGDTDFKSPVAQTSGAKRKHPDDEKPPSAKSTKSTKSSTTAATTNTKSDTTPVVKRKQTARGVGSHSKWLKYIEDQKRNSRQKGLNNSSPEKKKASTRTTVATTNYQLPLDFFSIRDYCSLM